VFIIEKRFLIDARSFRSLKEKVGKKREKRERERERKREKRKLHNDEMPADR